MTSESPGWDAIDARLAELYPDVEPKHYGTLHRFVLGGPDPLDGISFYTRLEPVPHWHIVGYGMSELYAKESDESDESGWGFEFTFRIARETDETEPPAWAANLLQNLARYVYSTGNWFEPGHHMDANGPIRLGYETALTALAFVADPELGAIASPHGRLQFLQVVGLTADEYAAARQWNTEGVLSLLAERQPLLVTDLDRPSLTADPAAQLVIEAGRARDGSSFGLLMVSGFTTTAEQDTIRLRFKSITTATVAQAVRDRLAHGRHLVLVGDGTRVALQNAEVFAIRQPKDDVLEVDLPPEAVAALPDALMPGTHTVPGTSSLIIEVSIA